MNTTMKTCLAAFVAVAASVALHAQEEGGVDDLEVVEVNTLDELLQNVEERRVVESQEHLRREAEFQARKDQQARMLADARAEKRAQERRSERLETTFEENEIRIGQMQEQYDKRLGSLRELFGVLQQVSDPVTIYERPANTFVADFIGSPSINFLKGEWRDGAVSIAGHRLRDLPSGASGPVTLGVRPEDVILVEAGEGVMDGTIDFTEPYGGVVIAFIALEDGESLLERREYLAASVDVHQPLTQGARVGIRLRSERISFFDASTGVSLMNGVGAA